MNLTVLIKNYRIYTHLYTDIVIFC